MRLLSVRGYMYTTKEGEIHLAFSMSVLLCLAISVIFTQFLISL